VNGCQVLPIMPTAIDEYRMLDDGTYLQPSLTPRWQISSAELLCTQPAAPSGLRPFADYEDYGIVGLPPCLTRR